MSQVVQEVPIESESGCQKTLLYLEAEKIKLTCIGDRGSLEAQIFKVGSLREDWVHRTLSYT